MFRDSDRWRRLGRGVRLGGLRYTHGLVRGTNRMGNCIKESAGGLALQVTKPARDEAGLVEENSDGEATHLSDVVVYGFDGLLVVLGVDVSASDRAEIVASAARDTGSIHQGVRSTLATSGNGYQVQLPGATEAGFVQGDAGDVEAGDGVLFIHDGGHKRLIDDLETVRE